MTDLKPCPFCGGEGLLQTDELNSFWVMCSSCGCDQDSAYGREGAIAAWNSRAVPKLPEGYREDEEGLLWFGTICVAAVDNRGRLCTTALEHEFEALAIWLQRRLHAQS